MGTWNYRIIDHGDHLALHEVHYDDDGKPVGYTAEATSFVADPEEGRAGIISSLRMALGDAENPGRPTLTPAGFPSHEPKGAALPSINIAWSAEDQAWLATPVVAGRPIRTATADGRTPAAALDALMEKRFLIGGDLF